MKDQKNTERQIETLEQMVETLENKAKILEDKIISQNIIIDALVSTIRDITATGNGNKAVCATSTSSRVTTAGSLPREAFKNAASSTNPSNTNIRLPNTNIMAAPLSYSLASKRLHLPDSSATLSRAVPQESAALQPLPKEQIQPPAAAPVETDIPAQIHELFSSKANKLEFRMNFTFKEFVEYAGASYEYTTTNRKVHHPKNPQKQYIELNLSKLLKFILDNINKLSLNKISSSLFLLSSSIEYQHRLVIAHDIILELTDYSTLLFICGALFNNLNLSDDTLSLALKRILYHQYCIDTDSIADDRILSHMETIVASLGISREKESIWDYTEQLLNNNQPFFNKGTTEVNNECIRHGFALRMLCSYLDWDYVYNVLICERLKPRLEDGNTPENKAYLVYVLGILAMNAYRMFANDPSILNVFTEILGLMVDSSDVSIVAYLVLKQRYEAESLSWLELHSDDLTRKGFNINTIKSSLLI